jgi:hypothetical protein
VREVLNRENGILVPFFDVDQLASRVIDALAHGSRYRKLRTAARQTVLDKYDLAQTCLPALVNFIRSDERKSERETRLISKSIHAVSQPASDRPGLDPTALSPRALLSARRS